MPKSIIQLQPARAHHKETETQTKKKEHWPFIAISVMHGFFPTRVIELYSRYQKQNKTNQSRLYY